MASPYDLREPLDAERTQKFMSTDTVRAAGPREYAASPGKSGTIARLGAVIPQVIEASDAIIKKDISQTLHDATDQVNAEYGIDGRLFGQDVTDPNPINQQEMERMSENVRNLNAGYKAGKIADSHYWARLDSISRQMRTRYPGHREFIDDKISSIVGGTPANRLREEMMAEAKAKASGGEKGPFEKGVDDIVERSVKEGWGVTIIPDMFEQVANGTFDKYAAARKLQAYAGREAQIKAAENELSHQARVGEIDSKDALDTFSMVMDNNFVTSTATTIGPVADKYLELAKQVDVLNSQKTPTTPEQALQLSQAINNYRMTYMSQIEQEMTARRTGKDGQTWSYREVLNPTEQDYIYKQAERKFELLKDYATNPTAGKMHELKNYLDNSTASTRIALRQDDDFKILEAFKEMPLAVQNAFALKSGVLPKMMLKVQKGIYAGLVNGTYSSLDAATATAVQQISDDPSLGGDEKKKNIKDTVMGAVETQVATLTADDVTDEVFSKMVASTFGPKNQDFLRHFTDPDVKREVFIRLTSPAVADKLWEKRHSDPRVWETYSNWTRNNFLNLFKQHGNELNNTMLNRKYVDISFVGNRFRLSTRSYGEGKSVPTDPLYKIWKVGVGLQTIEEGTELVLNANAQTAVRSINSAIEGLESVIKKEGGDVQAEVRKALDVMGVNPDLKYQGSTVDQMYIGLGEVIRNYVDKMKKGADSIELDPETEKILNPEKNKQYELVE